MILLIGPYEKGLFITGVDTFKEKRALAATLFWVTKNYKQFCEHFGKENVDGFFKNYKKYRQSPKQWKEGYYKLHKLGNYDNNFK